ncbi:MAG TPA: Dickkopf N-terminal cysteine-rich domain-containing protein [Polyangia bacterium]|nr:Dickkopf N-terminal cysteine-rich domain-containing protein [Polyangia bacterium]
MRSLLLLMSIFAAAIAGGCGIGSFNDFRDQLNTRWCERQLRCGEVAGTESNTLCGTPAPLTLVMNGEVDAPSSIAAGRMHFHPDNAAACLKAVEHAPCEPAQAGEDLFTQCHGVLSGTVANGDSCWGDDECIGGVCVNPDCGGTCTAYASPGSPCVKSGGTPDVTCDPSVHFCSDTGTCVHKVGVGKPCLVDENCLFDFVCVDEKCAPLPRTKRDDVCGTNLPPCQDGLYCNETGTCEPLVDAGGACAKADACKAGMTCESGLCAPWLDTGAACVDDPNAIASGCAASDACTGGVCAAVPGAKAGPLAHCGADADCDDGLFCASGNYCYYVGGINAVCQSDHECAPDLQCLMGACHAPGFIMCASASM